MGSGRARRNACVDGGVVDQERSASTSRSPVRHTGIELGMTPGQASIAFLLREEVDPVVGLLNRYGSPTAALEERRANEQFRKRFFRVEPSMSAFAEGVTSADARSMEGVI
jgi:hypothetical protein